MSSGSKPSPSVEARSRVGLFAPGARNEIEPPRPFMGGGGSGGYTPAAPLGIAQPGPPVKGKPPQAAAHTRP